MTRREKNRDDREYDTTQLHESLHGVSLHRDYSAHFWRWSFARRFITAQDHVLEIGCGQETPLAKILTRGATNHCASYLGVDLNRLKQSNSQRLTFLGEFNFVERWGELHGRSNDDSVSGGYDVIVHYEVIEHMKVEHGAKLLKACFALLKPGGAMLMSTPCYDGVRHAANHIHEYTVPELQAVTEKAGFHIERRFGTFMDIKHIGKARPEMGLGDNHPNYAQHKPDLIEAVQMLYAELSAYYDSNAISCIFAPLYPDHARNNLWLCRKPVTSKFELTPSPKARAKGAALPRNNKAPRPQINRGPWK